MLLKLDGPLDLESTLHSGQAFRWRRSEGWHHGVLGRSAVHLRVTGDRLECRTDEMPEEKVGPALTEYLGLEEDLEAIYNSIRIDEAVGEAIDRFRGMRILRQDPWECLATFICTANSNVARVRGNIEDIAALCGDPIDDGQFAFPTAEGLASVGPEALRAVGLGYRAEYLHGAAVAVAEGRVNPWALRQASYEQALAALMGVPGVGDKVANCVMLFSLNKPEAFPVDVWIHRALEEIYPAEIRSFRRRLMRSRGPGRPRPGRRADGAIISRERLGEWGRMHFGSRAGWANHYLFHARRTRTEIRPEAVRRL